LGVRVPPSAPRHAPGGRRPRQPHGSTTRRSRHCRSAAADLQTEPHGADGPRASSVYVLHHQGGTIRHRNTEVRLITSTEAARALDAAISGDVAGAVALVSTVRQHQPRQMDHTYEIIRTGETFDRHGDPDRELIDRLIDGQIREVGQ
jgi:hypothetical protein